SLVQGGQDQQARPAIEGAELLRGRVRQHLDEAAALQSRDPLGDVPDVRRMALPADDEPARRAPGQEREGVEKPKDVLVGQDVADEQDVGELAWVESGLRPRT